MREAETPGKRSILRSWLFWGLLSGLTSAVVVTLWLRFTSASAQVSQENKAEDALSPLPALQRRVDAGDPEAQRLMAIRFLSGDGVLRSAEESKKLYDLSVSGGNAQAMYELACLHDTGHPGFPRDAVMAWDLYSRAAKAGQFNAMAYVSEAYEGGPTKDLVSSYAWRSLAIHLYQLSERQSNISFMVNGSLGWMGVANYDQDYIYGSYRPSSRNDSSYYEYTRESTSLLVIRHDVWLNRISRKLSDPDILLAQKRSREILAEIDAKTAKK
jgi:TPR repeat protein